MDLVTEKTMKIQAFGIKKVRALSLAESSFCDDLCFKHDNVSFDKGLIWSTLPWPSKRMKQQLHKENIEPTLMVLL